MLLTIAMIDVDNFKKINDKYGHHMGDEVLKNTVKILSKYTRKSDALGRLGGDEFVIIMVGNNINQAKVVCEKLCRIVQKHRHPKVGSVNISIGVAELTDNNSEETLLLKADKALYRAKAKGGNRVEG